MHVYIHTVHKYTNNAYTLSYLRVSLKILPKPLG